MIKALASLWRNYFNYTGRTGRKEYWLGIVGNVIAMYVAVIPTALFFAKVLPVPIEVFVPAFLSVFLLPVLAAYFRRIWDIGWKPITALVLTLFTPVFGGILVGLFPSAQEDDVPTPLRAALPWYLFAVSFGLYFYGAVLGVVLYDDPIAIPALPLAGLALGTVTLLLLFFGKFRAEPGGKVQDKKMDTDVVNVIPTVAASPAALKEEHLFTVSSNTVYDERTESEHYLARDVVKLGYGYVLRSWSITYSVHNVAHNTGRTVSSEEPIREEDIAAYAAMSNDPKAQKYCADNNEEENI